MWRDNALPDAFAAHLTGLTGNLCLINVLPLHSGEPIGICLLFARAGLSTMAPTLPCPLRWASGLSRQKPYHQRHSFSAAGTGVGSRLKRMLSLPSPLPVVWPSPSETDPASPICSQLQFRRHGLLLLQQQQPSLPLSLSLSSFFPLLPFHSAWKHIDSILIICIMTHLQHQAWH